MNDEEYILNNMITDITVRLVLTARYQGNFLEKEKERKDRKLN